MQRIVFVHGSVGNGSDAWAGQEGFADEYEVLALNRPGFPPGPPADRIDFEVHGAWVADQLRPGDHLCGASYGGVVSMYAAGAFPDLASLTVIEPPAFGIVADRPEVAEFVDGLKGHWAGGESDPRLFLQGFMALVAGRDVPPLPDPLPATLEQGARMLMVERGPWEADPPFAPIAAAGYPVLAVSGGWSPNFDAVLEVIARELGAERATAAGAGHAAQRSADFNPIYREFLARVG